MRSASGGQGLPVGVKLREWAALARMARHDTGDRSLALRERLSEYSGLLEALSNRTLEESAIFEFGYGARPLMMLTMLNARLDATGIDLDQPAFSFSFREIVGIARRNGLERAVKSAIRSGLLDKRTYAALQIPWRELVANNPNAFLVGDITSSSHLAAFAGHFDLVVSEDVLEHVPVSALPSTLAALAQIMKPSGIAVLRPNVFTGITGGHLTDWYHDRVDKQLRRTSEPWEHLRQKRVQANTFLNKMWRREYRVMLNDYFEILDESPMQPQLGSQYLTERVRAELAEYPLEELFSNNVRWVVRRR